MDIREQISAIPHNKINETLKNKTSKPLHWNEQSTVTHSQNVCNKLIEGVHNE